MFTQIFAKTHRLVWSGDLVTEGRPDLAMFHLKGLDADTVSSKTNPDLISVDRALRNSGFVTGWLLLVRTRVSAAIIAVIPFAIAFRPETLHD